VAREILADVGAREELFANLSAREVEQVMEYLRAVAADDATPTSKVTPSPSKSESMPTPQAAERRVAKEANHTVTSTMTPTPTACTAKDLKRAKQHKAVEAARKTLKELTEVEVESGQLGAEEESARKKANRVIKRARARKAKKAKKILRKCRKAGTDLETFKCHEHNKDVCQAALSKVAVTEKECRAAKTYLDAYKRLKAATKAEWKAAKEGEIAEELTEELKAARKGITDAEVALEARVAPPPTVGADGVTTVMVMEGPTCTADAAAPAATPATGAKAKRELLDDIFAREYERLD